MPFLTIGGKRSGTTITRRQAQAIAQRNQLDAVALLGEKWSVGGLTVTLNDLRTDDEFGGHDVLHFTDQLDFMAAEVGAVVQHPNGRYDNDSFFVYPDVTPHKGGRSIMTSVRITPEIHAMLERLRKDNVPLSDIVDGAVRLNYQMRYEDTQPND